MTDAANLPALSAEDEVALAATYADLSDIPKEAIKAASCNQDAAYAIALRIVRGELEPL